MWSIWPYITLLSISPKNLKEIGDGRSSVHNVNPLPIIIPVTVNTFSVHVMIDTGAAHTLKTRPLLQTLRQPPIQTPHTTTAILGDAHTNISLYGMVPLCTYIYIYQSYSYTCLCFSRLITKCRSYYWNGLVSYIQYYSSHTSPRTPPLSSSIRLNSRPLSRYDLRFNSPCSIHSTGSLS